MGTTYQDVHNGFTHFSGIDFALKQQSIANRYGDQED